MLRTLPEGMPRHASVLKNPFVGSPRLRPGLRCRRSATETRHCLVLDSKMPTSQRSGLSWRLPKGRPTQLGV